MGRDLLPLRYGLLNRRLLGGLSTRSNGSLGAYGRRLGGCSALGGRSALGGTTATAATTATSAARQESGAQDKGDRQNE